MDEIWRYYAKWSKSEKDKHYITYKTQQEFPWWLMNPTGNHEVGSSIPDLAQWVQDSVLQCRLQMQLGSCFAVAVLQAGSYSAD